MGKWKHTLKLEIYLVNEQGEKELKEQLMTSPEVFFEQFPVHKSKMQVSRDGNSIVVKEIDEYKSKHYLAVVTDPRSKEDSFNDERALKALFDALSN